MAANPFDDPTPPDVESPESERPPESEKEDSDKLKWLEDIASLLLKEGLVLTCLELYTELLESGQVLHQLKDYFSNPGNFEHAIPQPVSIAKSDLSM